MNRQEEIRGAVLYALIVIATVIALGAIFVVTHEFIHSTTAYLMGHMQSPLDLVWGNPVTLDGWDEGVSYSAMFSTGQGAVAAIIAVSPLILHSVVVIGGMYLLLSDAMVRKKWLFHITFWLVIVNFMELVAYMPVRAFSLHGDIGNIDHGLGLNPWLLFLAGTPLILLGLYYLYRRVLPRMNAVVAGESHLVQVRDPRLFRVLPLPVPGQHPYCTQFLSRHAVGDRALRVCGIRGSPVLLPARYAVGH